MERVSVSLWLLAEEKKKWETRIRNPAGKDREWQRWSSTGCGGGGCQPEGGMQSNRITSKRGSEDGGGGTSSLVLLVPFSQSRKTMEPLQGGVSALYSGYFFHLLFSLQRKLPFYLYDTIPSQNKMKLTIYTNLGIRHQISCKDLTL